jgi:uncharacterized protein with PQ loop repeat
MSTSGLPDNPFPGRSIQIHRNSHTARAATTATNTVNTLHTQQQEIAYVTKKIGLSSWCIKFASVFTEFTGCHQWLIYSATIKQHFINRVRYTASPSKTNLDAKSKKKTIRNVDLFLKKKPRGTGENARIIGLRQSQYSELPKYQV